MSNSVIPFYTPEESLRLMNTKWKLTGQNFPVWKMHLDNILCAQGKLLIMKEILSLKLRKDQSVKDHLIEMRRLFKCLTRLGYKMTQEELVYLMWYSLPKEICETASACMKEPKIDVAKVHEDILASLEPKPAPAELMDSDWIDELGDLICPECGSGNHICNHLQGFTRRETLRKDHSNLRVGEGTPLIAEAVGSYSLSLPSGLVLELENCYYVPKMIKNVINSGPFSHEARGGYRYFITFTDDFSRYGYVYLMRHKSESFEKFREYQNEVQNQLDRKIKFLRSDRGGEYLSQEFGNHLIECGIVSQLTHSVYTSDEWCVRKEESYIARHGTIDDVSLYTTSIILGHALETTTHILNRAPTKSVENMPYELWKDHRGMLLLQPEENKVFVARNGKFLEEKFLSSGNTREDVDLQIVDENNTAPTVEPEIQHENVEPQSEPIEEVQIQDLRRSTRVRQEPNMYLGFLVSQDGGDLNEPTSYEEAVSGNESEQWQEAMKAEMQSMAIGRKWVFKKKTDMDGNVHTFKARLIAKGFTQTHGIDYDETFSPVAMLNSIRILMAISAYFNYEIWQMDVKTAFLNGKLTEDIYMEQPQGFEDPKNPNKVCKLLKSIYGLKQASRSWNLHFDERIKEFGFAKGEFEPCVYTKFSGSIVTFLVLYVNDILLIGNDVPVGFLWDPSYRSDTRITVDLNPNWKRYTIKPNDQTDPKDDYRKTELRGVWELAPVLGGEERYFPEKLKHPSKNYIANKPFPQYERLKIVFGKDRATGSLAESAADAMEHINLAEVGAETEEVQVPLSNPSGGASESSVSNDGEASSKKRKRKTNFAEDVVKTLEKGLKSVSKEMSKLVATIGNPNPALKTLPEELVEMGFNSDQCIAISMYFADNPNQLHLYSGMNDNFKLRFVTTVLMKLDML
ncbi:hypothetical protein OSB04_011648 [Centaurea solstitialis]|uniref:Integrase catalytic domain-containing protein n=1 Tax=Centaurea solstitialis TaxID=347529 RepID=A0AA38TBK7_9ASTR|nr:hypothetical protein OSB04_011648 [Centaurea solstitialis]